ncbi:MAG: hypothetical protein NC308_09905, partial [Clostridium sp.]|nr:hypothetical protein [Clostridium sp.]
MKKRVYILFSAVFALASCGTSAQFSSSDSRFQDGIYARTGNTSAKDIKKASSTDMQEVDELVAQTRSSEIYLLGDEPKTVVIPESKSTTVKFNNNAGASVTIEDAPDFTVYFNSTPSIYVSTAWSPWYYNSYWGYSSWYSPWRYSAWYYNSWRYDPWYWGYGYYDPW